jgi:hypothetical protein
MGIERRARLRGLLALVSDPIFGFEVGALAVAHAVRGHGELR